MRNKLVYTSLILFTCAVVFNACNEEEVNYQRYFVNGKQLYEQNCQNCHGANGEGLGKLYPPLSDTTYLAKKRSELACIIKNGLTGKISVNNESYEAVMPGNAALADIDVAQIIVYITNSFGNKQGFYDQMQVQADLKGCE
jgi:mono/diheme cytochrome c family protein